MEPDMLWLFDRERDAALLILLIDHMRDMLSERERDCENDCDCDFDWLSDLLWLSDWETLFDFEIVCEIERDMLTLRLRLCDWLRWSESRDMLCERLRLCEAERDRDCWGALTLTLALIERLRLVLPDCVTDRLME